jgi:tripartite-type tricarboxylate transporter receptor subunit TctC
MTSVPMLLKTAGFLLAFTAAAAAQEYPTKPVRVIIPFPPGAINDTVGRMVATQLSTRLGKQSVVDNRAGAGGVIGTELADNAPKDGYTLLIVSLVNTPWLYKLTYEPIASFAPIAIIASAPNVLVVHPELPAKSVQELIALAKEKPGQIPYASGGVGSFQHLGGELFRLRAGVDEAGVPGYEAANWIGLVAPAGTPPAIVAQLNREITAIQDTPEMQKQFADQGLEIMRMSPADFGAFMVQELGKWERVVKEGGIKPE